MKIWTDIMAAIEEAEFLALENRRQMFVIQKTPHEMVVSRVPCAFGGRVVYKTGVRR